MLYQCYPKFLAEANFFLKKVCMLCAKTLQSCLILCDPMDCSPPGFSVHEILQARLLPCPPPGDLPDPGINLHLLSPALAGRFFTTSATRGSLLSILNEANFVYSFIHSFILWPQWVCIAAHGLSLVAASGGYSAWWCVGSSLRWLPLLWSTGSKCTGFSSCSTWAQQLWHTPQLLRGMWYLPRPGIKSASLALQDVFLTTLPPGKLCAANFESCLRCLKKTINVISWINFYTNNRLL